MTKARFPGFAACMRMMRNRGQIAEEGFLWLLERASEFVEPLMEEFHREPDDGLRPWLLELIGEARDPRAMPLFLQLLDSPDVLIRSCAISGLSMLNTKECRRILFELNRKAAAQ